MKKAQIIIVCASVFFSCLALAHTEATGIVKERMDAMKDMGKKSKRVANMFKGKTEFEHTALIEAADSFVLHGKQMKELFPDTHDSRMGKSTEALAKIWDDAEGFSQKVDEFINLSESLQNTVATTKDQKQLKQAFLENAKSCSGCHKKYRKPKR